MSQGFTKEIGYGNAFVVGETPAGLVNSSNTLYTLANGYIGSTTMVWLNGQRKFVGDDYTETGAGAGTFTFVTAPATGASVRVDYMKMNSVAGNADTVDGYHANTFTKYKGWEQDYASGVTTDTELGNQLIQRGWSYGTGSGAVFTDVTITLPVAYDDDDYDIFIQYIGVKTTAGTPADREGFNGAFVPFSTMPKAGGTKSTSAFDVRMEAGVAITSGWENGFSWMTIGTKA